MIKKASGRRFGQRVSGVPTASADECHERHALWPFAGRAAAVGIAAVHVASVAAADEHANAAQTAAPGQQQSQQSHARHPAADVAGCGTCRLPGPLRNPHPIAGADAIRRILSIRGLHLPSNSTFYLILIILYIKTKWWIDLIDLFNWIEIWKWIRLATWSVTCHPFDTKLTVSTSAKRILRSCAIPSINYTSRTAAAKWGYSSRCVQSTPPFIISPVNFNRQMTTSSTLLLRLCVLFYGFLILIRHVFLKLLFFSSFLFINSDWFVKHYIYLATTLRQATSPFLFFFFSNFFVQFVGVIIDWLIKIECIEYSIGIDGIPVIRHFLGCSGHAPVRIQHRRHQCPARGNFELILVN